MTMVDTKYLRSSKRSCFIGSYEADMEMLGGNLHVRTEHNPNLNLAWARAHSHHQRPPLSIVLNSHDTGDPVHDVIS